MHLDYGAFSLQAQFLLAVHSLFDLPIDALFDNDVSEFVFAYLVKLLACRLHTLVSFPHVEN